MVIVVRGKYDLGRGAPLALCRDARISDEATAAVAEVDPASAAELGRAAVHLGQGNLRAEAHREGDEDRVGDLVYPGDFADFKLNAEVVARGHCHAPKGATECEVELSIGAWKKTLRVVGTRVRTDRVAGGSVTTPQPIGTMAVDYAHAYGGPGFHDNPIGKDHVETIEGEAKDLYQPPRSERSAVMTSLQLPNVLYADGATTKNGLPAGFAPLSPYWPHRRNKRGTRYGADWLRERAPHYAEDFDYRHFHAAPPDQQLDGYLRGDEVVSFRNMHPIHARLSVPLPGIRVRAFVLDDRGEAREAVMRLDTLYAELDDDALYLTWRGHAPVREEDLSDVQFGLVATEPLAEQPKPMSHYESLLRDFAADPVGMKTAFPEGFQELADSAERIELASDAELEAMTARALASDDPAGPFGALQKLIFGPLAPKLEPQTAAALRQAAGKLSATDLKAQLLSMLRTVGMSSGGGIMVEPGAKPVAAIAGLLRQAEEKLAAIERATPEAQAKVDATLARLRQSPLSEIDPSYRPWSPDDPPPDEPGPNANLAGRDLSDRDLSGMDLSGANLEGAILSRTKLRGSNLRGARLGAATLFKTDLTDADLTGADLKLASLKRVSAERARLDTTKLDMTRFDRCDFRAASLVGAAGKMLTISKSRFDGVAAQSVRWFKAIVDETSLREADLTQAMLERCDIKGCGAQGLRLEQASIAGTAFHRCELGGAKARAVQGRQSVWMGSKLVRADFGRADLPAAHFLEVDASDASFLSANLSVARFDRAVLRRADFSRAKLSGANLRLALLSEARFVDSSLYDAKLIQAAGSDVDFAGANLTRANFQRSEIERR